MRVNQDYEAKGGKQAAKSTGEATPRDNRSLAKRPVREGVFERFSAGAIGVFEAIHELDRASVDSADERKRRGVVYTPKAVALSMCEMLAPALGARVLEPSCGRGVFVFALVETQRARFNLTWEETARWGEEHLFASDLDGAALADLARLWTLFFELHGVRSDLTPNLREGDALFAGFSAERFDAVVGNPPYVRIQNLSEATRQAIRAKYAACAKGNVDLYYAFCAQALATADRVCFIVPNSLLSNASAKALRSQLAPRLSRLIDFGAREIFAPAGAYACVFLAEAAAADSSDANRSTLSLADALSVRENLPEEGGSWRPLLRRELFARTRSWGFASLCAPACAASGTLATEPTDGRSAAIGFGGTASVGAGGSSADPRGGACRLGDFAEVFVGIGTNADGCYKLPPGEMTDSPQGPLWAFDDPLTETARALPLDLCPRFLKLTKVRDRAEALDPLGQRILCPYDAEWALVPHAALPRDAQGWLRARKPQLTARDKGKIEGYEAWHAFGRRHGFVDFAPTDRLFLIPAMAHDVLRPIEVRGEEMGGRFVFTSGFVLRAKNDADADRLAAFLSSEACWSQLLRAGKAWPGARPYRTFGARLLRELEAPADLGLQELAQAA